MYQTVQYFTCSKSGVLYFVAVKYSLHQSGKTTLHQKMTIHQYSLNGACMLRPLYVFSNVLDFTKVN